MVQYWKQLQLTPRFILSHKLSIPSSNTLSNANAPITIVTANVEVRRNKALYTVLPILILALESSRNPSLYFHRLLGARWRLRVFILQRTMVKFQVAKCDGIFTSSSRQVSKPGFRRHIFTSLKTFWRFAIGCRLCCLMSL